MYYPPNISPAPRRESVCVREGYVTETKSLLHKPKSIYRRFFYDRAWTESGALTYILAGGRFNFDAVDFESLEARAAAMEAQAVRDYLRNLLHPL
jgi:hypothetical protein